MIEIYIPLSPTPWAAPKLSKRRIYDPREIEKRVVRYYIKQQYNGPLLTAYTAIKLSYRFKPPSSTSKKRRVEMLAGKIIPTKSDCTNLQKLYEDCLKGLVIDDDRKVAKIFSEKLYGEKDEIFINIFTLEEYNNEHNCGRC